MVARTRLLECKPSASSAHRCLRRHLRSGHLAVLVYVVSENAPEGRPVQAITLNKLATSSVLAISRATFLRILRKLVLFDTDDTHL